MYKQFTNEGKKEVHDHQAQKYAHENKVGIAICSFVYAHYRCIHNGIIKQLQDSKDHVTGEEQKRHTLFGDDMSKCVGEVIR